METYIAFATDHMAEEHGIMLRATQSSVLDYALNPVANGHGVSE